MRRYLLAYDADCGPCTNFKRAVVFLDSYQRITPIPLAQADSEGILDRIPASRRHRSFHLVAPDGDALSGPAAIPTLVSLLPGGRFPSRLVTSAPGGRRAVSFVYQVFSRLHDSGSCGFRPGSGRSGLVKDLDDAVTPRVQAEPTWSS